VRPVRALLASGTRPAVVRLAVSRPAVGPPAVGPPAVGRPAAGRPTVGRLAIGLLIAALLAAAASPAAASPAAASASGVARTTLPAIEEQAMCVTCKIPLPLAQSPQANRERAFIAQLIAAGDTEAQIKRALVREYGPAVLALPSAHGFDLAAYLVPAAVVLGVLVLLGLLLPRWRARARADAPPGGAGGAGGDPSSTLSPADAARLEADMARFD